MKRAIPSFLVVGALLVASTAVVSAADERTLKGEFRWHHRDTTGDLEAVFTPSGDGVWDVSFHFEFRGEPHVYTGVAEGSLSDGALKGEVTNENKKRSFTFEGRFEGGKFSGTHAETTAGRESDTGTLTLGS